MKSKGFLLIDSLLTLFLCMMIVLLCYGTVYVLNHQQDLWKYHALERNEQFYHVIQQTNHLLWEETGEEDTF